MILSGDVCAGEEGCAFHYQVASPLAKHVCAAYNATSGIPYPLSIAGYDWTLCSPALHLLGTEMQSIDLR